MRPAVDHRLQRGLLELDELGQLVALEAGEVAVEGLVVGAGEHAGHLDGVLAGVVVGDHRVERLLVGGGHRVPELDLDRAGGGRPARRPGRGRRRPSALAALGALGAAAAAPAVVAATARGGHEGQRGQQTDEQGVRFMRRHPFTAPAVSPRTRWRWNTIRTSAMGRAAMRVPAITRLSSSTLAELRLLRPTWIGADGGLVGDQQGPEVLVPGVEEAEDGQAGDGRTGQRDGHVPHEPDSGRSRRGRWRPGGRRARSGTTGGS